MWYVYIDGYFSEAKTRDNGTRLHLTEKTVSFVHKLLQETGLNWGYTVS